MIIARKLYAPLALLAALALDLIGSVGLIGTAPLFLLLLLSSLAVTGSAKIAGRRAGKYALAIQAILSICSAYWSQYWFGWGLDGWTSVVSGQAAPLIPLILVLSVLPALLTLYVVLRTTA